MLKVYDVFVGFTYSQVHSVVAESIAEVEELYKKAYPGCTIKEITLHSEYVLVKE